MNKAVFAVDTSNYTTSAALFYGGEVIHARRILPVAAGSRGLRQNDAVFLHNRQLPEVIEELFDAAGISFCDIAAIGCSDRPRDAEDSYMPCFTAGTGFCRGVARMGGLPLRLFSHQAGHIAAGLWSAGRLDWLCGRFLTLHISGGTLEAVVVEPEREKLFATAPVGGTLDISAGQVIDRVGVMLGLGFPCGAELERLALASEMRYTPKVSRKGSGLNLSGVENICAEMYNKNCPKADIARFCFDYLGRAISGLLTEIYALHGRMNTLICGGVAANSIIRQAVCETVCGDGGAEAGVCFSLPEYSTDNAAGTAVLAALAENIFE